MNDSNPMTDGGQAASCNVSADARKRRMLRELRHTGPDGMHLMITCKLLAGFAVGLALALLPVTAQQAADVTAAAPTAQPATPATDRLADSVAR